MDKVVRARSAMKLTLCTICICSTLIQPAPGAPLVDDSLQSRVLAVPDDMTANERASSGYADPSLSRTETDSARSAILDESESSSADREDMQCKVVLRADIEQCLHGFEQQKTVFENPHMTAQQRINLTPDFCT